MFSEQDSVLNN